GTELPPHPYSFSFATQRGRTQLSSDTLPQVAEQMAEVKELCKMLFDARVNRIGNIRRARVCMDDRNSSFATDYTTPTVLDVVTDPSGQMISSPYEFTFFSFTAELADVVNRLERSDYGFLLKAIQVEPEDGKMGEPAGAAAQPPTPLNQ